MISFIRRLFLLCLLLVLLGLFLFPKEIFLKCIDWKVSSYCRKTFGAKLLFDHLSWENGMIVMEGGSVVKDEDFQIHFNQASLSPSMSLLKREIGGELEIEGLKIIHRKKELRPLSIPNSAKWSLFTFNLKTSIKQGELFLSDSLIDPPFCRQYCFDLIHKIQHKQTVGTVTLDLNPKFTTYFLKREDNVVELMTNFHSHSFPDLFHLFSYFFQEKLPEPLLHWHMTEGSIDGNLNVVLVDGEPLKMGGKMNLLAVEGENRILELLGAIDQVECDLDIDFSKVSAINGKFSLRGGKLALQEHGEIWPGMWDLKNLHSDICVKEGKVESTTLKGNLMGMEGELLLDWHSNETMMKMGFQGSSKKMKTLLPTTFQEKFITAFPNDEFKLEAALNRSGMGLELEGILEIKDQKQKSYLLDFGCILGKGEPEGEVEIVPENLPFSLSRSVDSFLVRLQDQFCLSQKRYGWFRGENFPLEKFLSPFLLHHVNIEALGVANFEATFDERYVVLFYEGENFRLESPHFSLQVDKIEEEIISDIVAVHYIDLHTWNHVGFLPLKEARYWQKKYDFCLENSSAIVHFEKNDIYIRELETHWNQLNFRGDLQLSIQALDNVDLHIKADRVEGPVADARRFLSHFNNFFLWSLPFEGEVVSEEKVLNFHYHFSPYASLVQAEIQGDMVLGSFPYFPLNDYLTHVEYRFHPAQPHLEDLSVKISNENETFLNFDWYSQLEGEGKTIVLEGEALSLKAHQNQNAVTISEFVCGRWHGSGSFDSNESLLSIDDFTCWANEHAGFRFSGAYQRSKGMLSGMIEEFKWDLGEIASPWKPKGEIAGSATVQWKVGDELQIRSSASFKDLEFGGIYFGAGEDLSCFYSSIYGISVEGLEAEIAAEEGAERYKLGRFHYDIEHQKALFEGFDFSLPPEKLSWVADVASSMFPGKIHPTVVDWVEALKHNEPLEGRVSLEVFPDHIWVYLTLKDGVYYLSDKQLDLKNFYLIYDPLELNIWTQCLYHENYYWLHFLTDSMTTSHGKVSISERELSSEQPESFDALCVTWEKQSGKGWCVRQAEGSFSGIHAMLHSSGPMDFSDTISLKGQIGFDPQRAAPLLKQEIQDVIEKFSLGGGIAIEGELKLNKRDFSDIVFLGQLSGQECQIGGLSFSNFSSHLEYEPNYIKLSHLDLKDWAGRLFLKEALLTKQEQEWSIFLDELRLEDLRLSRLKSPWTQWDPKKKPFFRSLFIRSFSLDRCSGKLGEASKLVGTGSVEFTNLPKKTLFTNLLFLPTELTARIGLDLSALIPVRGKIIYEIRDGKIFFNEFKEMYSDGKRSRFYLAEGAPAYIDFLGNLNMKIKMKQYSLLMKLAEFFTITVKGTILHPNYTFSNHIDDEDI